MYRKILIALDHSEHDRGLLAHVIQLAGLMQSQVLLLHVADGWVARNFDQLNLAESEEMREDWKRLEATKAQLETQSALTVSCQLALGNPPDEILKVAATEQVDLIALASHGHRLLGDLIHGSTIDAVRHRARVPLLVIAPHTSPSSNEPGS